LQIQELTSVVRRGFVEVAGLLIGAPVCLQESEQSLSDLSRFAVLSSAAIGGRAIPEARLEA
jgi:hypothetical protein